MRIILVHGTSFVSKLIEWQSRGQWSHAALLFPDNTVIESRERHNGIKGGVRKLSFDEWVKGGDKFKIFTVETTEKQTSDIRAFAEAQVGKPYDYLGVARFVTRRNYASQPDDKWWCSEIVFVALQEGGIDLFARTEGWEVAPQLLPRSVLVKDG